MNTFQSMENLYKLVEKIEDSQEARNLLISIFTNVMYDIQDEGAQLTAHEIEVRLETYLKDFTEAAKNSKVA